MWESPIKILQNQIKWELEEEIMKAVCKYGIDVDKDRLLEMLRGDSRSYDIGYATGKREVCERILERLEEYRRFEDHDSLDRQVIDRAIEIVKEEM